MIGLRPDTGSWSINDSRLELEAPHLWLERHTGQWTRWVRSTDGFDWDYVGRRPPPWCAQKPQTRR